jgi:serine acetyltransferase
VGHGCVLAANSVVRGTIPPMSIVGGVPGRVLKSRTEVYEAGAARRAALADIERKHARAVRATQAAREGVTAD